MRGSVAADIAARAPREHLRAMWDTAVRENADEMAAKIASRPDAPRDVLDQARRHPRASVRSGWYLSRHVTTEELVEAIAAERGANALVGLAASTDNDAVHNALIARAGRKCPAALADALLSNKSIRGEARHRVRVIAAETRGLTRASEDDIVYGLRAAVGRHSQILTETAGRGRAAVAIAGSPELTDEQIAELIGELVTDESFFNGLRDRIEVQRAIESNPNAGEATAAALTAAAATSKHWARRPTGRTPSTPSFGAQLIEARYRAVDDPDELDAHVELVGDGLANQADLLHLLTNPYLTLAHLIALSEHLSSSHAGAFCARLAEHPSDNGGPRDLAMAKVIAGRPWVPTEGFFDDEVQGATLVLRAAKQASERTWFRSVVEPLMNRNLVTDEVLLREVPAGDVLNRRGTPQYETVAAHLATALVNEDAWGFMTQLMDTDAGLSATQIVELTLAAVG